MNKILCVWDASGSAALKCRMDQLKDLMTSESICVQPKCKAPFEMPNTFNLLVTTNEPNPFPLDASDSRFVVYECNGSKVGDFGYFENLAATLNDKTARAFFQYLISLDLSNFGSFYSKRPETQLYRQLYLQQKGLNIPAIYSFLSHESVKWAGVAADPCKASEVFERFNHWAEGETLDVRDFTILDLGNAFNTLMKKGESGVSRRRGTNGRVYIINWSQLASCLKHHGLFYANAI